MDWLSDYPALVACLLCILSAALRSLNIHRAPCIVLPDLQRIQRRRSPLLGSAGALPGVLSDTVEFDGVEFDACGKFIGEFDVCEFVICEFVGGELVACVELGAGGGW